MPLLQLQERLQLHSCQLGCSWLLLLLMRLRLCLLRLLLAALHPQLLLHRLW
jgi:hypothetical protein